MNFRQSNRELKCWYGFYIIKTFKLPSKIKKKINARFPVKKFGDKFK